MSKINDGGCAFPFEGGTNNGYSPDPGMTLRDWFAGQALAGALAKEGAANSSITTMHRGHFVARIYEIADAMLAAREGEKP